MIDFPFNTMNRTISLLSVLFLTLVSVVPPVLAEDPEPTDDAIVEQTKDEGIQTSTEAISYEDQCRSELGFGDRVLQGTLKFWLNRCISNKKASFAEDQEQMTRMRRRELRWGRSFGVTRGDGFSNQVIEAQKRRTGIMRTMLRSDRKEEFRRFRSLKREGIREQNLNLISAPRASRGVRMADVVPECMEMPTVTRWLCIQKNRQQRLLTTTRRRASNIGPLRFMRHYDPATGTATTGDGEPEEEEEVDETE